MKIALIGSGLASIGALSVLINKKVTIDQFLSQESPSSTIKNRIYLQNKQVIIHKSHSSIEYLKRDFERINNLRVSGNYKLGGLLTSSFIGGLSNYWGGTSRRLLDSESQDFLRNGLDIEQSYETVLNFISNKGLKESSLIKQTGEGKSLKWVTSENLRQKDSEKVFSARSFIKTLNINKIKRSVIRLESTKKGVKITHKDKRNEETTIYDLVFVAAGAISSSILAGRLLEKNINTGLLINDQKIFFAKYELSNDILGFFRENKGPPSLLLESNKNSRYIQLYPIESLRKLSFLEGYKLNKSGYLFGLIYEQSKNSNAIALSMGKNELNLKIRKSLSYNFNKLDIRNRLKEEGISIIGPILNLASGNSQHISSTLSKTYNPLNKMEKLSDKFNFKDHKRVVFVDPSIMPYPPLCTIGLTGMAVSNYITKEWIENF